MGDNLRIRKLRLDLVNVLNESNLPIEIQKNALELLLCEVRNLADKAVQMEIEAEQNKEKESEEDGIQ